MFSFLKKKKVTITKPGDLFYTDIHAHWLPGIDDGAKNLEESLHMLEIYFQLGYRKLIATPHIYSDFYPNTPSSIQKAFDQVQKAAGEILPGLELGFAAEYYMDEHFSECLKNKSLLTIRKNEVLVEQNFFVEIPNIKDTLFEMQIKGYQPVLAHPERYTFYHANLNKIKAIKDSGVKLQVNLLSLAGKYGKETAKIADTLITNGWVDYIGTDAHSPAALKMFQNMKVTKNCYNVLKNMAFN